MYDVDWLTQPYLTSSWNSASWADKHTGCFFAWETTEMMHRQHGTIGQCNKLIAAVWLTQILNQQLTCLCLTFLFIFMWNEVTEQCVSSRATCSPFSCSCVPFGYRHSYVNTVESTCKCGCVCVLVFAICIRMRECTQKPFEVPHSLFTPLPHVSSLFEDHVAMIIKAALFRLQTYGMNMDMIWHQTFSPTPFTPIPSCSGVKFDRPCHPKQSLWELNLSFSARLGTGVISDALCP